jgi:hypothetical protein
MKKLTISLLAVIFSIGAALSQPVSDMGIIPVGVTLNSILRLNITGGGNIEYSVNTMDHYTNGIDAQAPYITTFTVASSVQFLVNLYSDNGFFTGVSAGSTFNVNNLGYTLSENGSGTAGINWLLDAGTLGVSAISNTIIDGTGLPSAGDISQNDFQLDWELGTSDGATMNASNLLLQNITSDRYVVNVILELVPVP